MENNKGINVLSCFDGISCGRIALERAGIKVDNYFASEIDKYAIQIANKNYPQDSDKRLGDVTKWQDWNIDWSSIDLVTGGFPCQAWSVAGKQRGDKDERGMLFWTMLDIMKKVLEHNPKANFLIENVKMKKEFEEYITLHTTQALGTVYKYLINSALVSAQNRQRYYWTSIKDIKQPEDKGILLRDILEDNIQSLRPCELREYKQDSICHHIADTTDIKGNECIKRVYADSGKAPTLTTMTGGHREPKVLIIPEQVKVRKYEVDITKLQDILRSNRKPIKYLAEALNVNKTTVEHWFRTDKCFSIPDSDVWLQLKEELGITTDEFDKSIMEFEIKDGSYELANRVYNPNYKSPTIVSSNVPKVLINESMTKDGKAYALTANYNGAVAWNSCEKKQRTMIPTSESSEIAPNTYKGLLYRKLTPLECERLQTVPDNYTDGVSNSQRYKMLGNGWTVDVIAHIFKGLKDEA